MPHCPNMQTVYLLEKTVKLYSDARFQCRPSFGVEDSRHIRSGTSPVCCNQLKYVGFTPISDAYHRTVRVAFKERSDGLAAVWLKVVDLNFKAFVR